VEEKGNSLLLEKGHHTPAKRKTTIEKTTKNNQSHSKCILLSLLHTMKRVTTVDENGISL